MKKYLAAIAVLTSLVLAPTALANPNVTGSASQACVEESAVLTASFSNAGFDEGTTVTVTDSQAGVLATDATSPFSTTQTYPGPDRAAGSVTFVWSHGSSGGTIVAPYDAVSGCVGPPPPTTTTTTPPPPPPGNNVHIGTAPHGSSPPPAPRKATPPEAQPAPQAIKNGELPFSGIETPILAMLGLGLVGMGLLVRRKAH